MFKTLQNPNYFGENLKEKSFSDQDVWPRVYDKSSYHSLEILEVAGHEDQDAIDALNLYRGGQADA